MSEASDLRLYKESVVDAMRRSLETGATEVFENKGPDHARIVLQVMLDSAESSVDLVADCMDAEVWPADQLHGFLNRCPTAVVRAVLTCDATLPERSLARMLADQSRVTVRHFPVQVAKHFCVVDERHVRLEYDKDTREASVTFSDPRGIGAKASSLFEKLWEVCGRHQKAPA